MNELIHKNCGGKIFISISDVEGLGEGYCIKCFETIDRREQIKGFAEEGDSNEEWKNARDAYCCTKEDK